MVVIFAGDIMTHQVGKKRRSITKYYLSVGVLLFSTIVYVVPVFCNMMHAWSVRSRNDFVRVGRG